LPKGDRPPEPLDPAEVRRMLTACGGGSLGGMRNHAILAVMWRCGLRVAETLDLRLSDVNFSAGTIRVRFGKGRKARTVGADAGVLAVIGVWADARTAAGIPDASPLFCRLHPQRGERLSREYVAKVMNRLAVEAGIDHRVHPHGLRHSFAVDSVREGIPVPVISRQLGHASVGTTETYLQGLHPHEVVEIYRSRSWPA
jgi:site-specific recombinase XerD